MNTANPLGQSIERPAQAGDPGGAGTPAGVVVTRRSISTAKEQPMHNVAADPGPGSGRDPRDRHESLSPAAAVRTWWEQVMSRPAATRLRTLAYHLGDDARDHLLGLGLLTGGAIGAAALTRSWWMLLVLPGGLVLAGPALVKLAAIAIEAVVDHRTGDRDRLGR